MRPESPAYAAGMRDGMRLLRREAGTIGGSSVEIVYRVKDGETERAIRYLPQGTAQVTLQRVIPVPEREGRDRSAVTHGRCFSGRQGGAGTADSQRPSST